MIDAILHMGLWRRATWSETLRHFVSTNRTPIPTTKQVSFVCMDSIMRFNGAIRLGSKPRKPSGQVGYPAGYSTPLGGAWKVAGHRDAGISERYHSRVGIESPREVEHKIENRKRRRDSEFILRSR